MKYSRLLRRAITGLSLVMISVFALVTSGCDDSESFTDLLNSEQRAINAYLATQRVEPAVPEDSIFEVGEKAPFYRMDDDGHVYMQVVKAGDKNNRPKANDKVYFRFSRMNLKNLYETGETVWDGNLDNMTSALGPTYFFYGNTTYPTTTQYGTGIQLPMNYLGYYSEVNLVIRAYAGFSTDQSLCIPYLVNVKYYRPEY